MRNRWFRVVGLIALAALAVTILPLRPDTSPPAAATVEQVDDARWVMARPIQPSDARVGEQVLVLQDGVVIAMPIVREPLSDDVLQVPLDLIP